MSEHRMDEIDADLEASVQVSTPEENDSDDPDCVTLRIISGGSTLMVLLEPNQAEEIAAALQKHARRA